MLRRQQQIRSQFLHLVDSGLFAVSFWLAHFIRAHASELGPWAVQFLARLSSEPKILPFDTYFPLFFLAIPLSLFVIESQGFYKRAVTRWQQTAWQLFQITVMVTVTPGMAAPIIPTKTPTLIGMSWDGLKTLAKETRNNSSNCFSLHYREFG